MRKMLQCAGIQHSKTPARKCLLRIGYATPVAHRNAQLQESPVGATHTRLQTREILSAGRTPQQSRVCRAAGWASRRWSSKASSGGEYPLRIAVYLSLTRCGTPRPRECGALNYRSELFRDGEGHCLGRSVWEHTQRNWEAEGPLRELLVR